MSRHISESSYQQLQELCQASQLTTSGRNWLIGAVDPFHDVDFDVEGFPDTECASTITQLVKLSTAIAAPGSAGAGNWDLLVVALPLHGTVNAQNQSINATPSFGGATALTSYPTGTGTGAGNAQLGNLIFIAGPAGTVLGSTSGAAAPAGATFGALNPVQYAKGQSRIVGSAFEVVNTTAELNLQGSVTCFRKPCTATTDIALPGTAATVSSPYRHFPLWVTTQAEADLMAGARTWPAKEGAYVVQTMNDIANPISQGSAMVCAFDPLDINTTGYQSTNTICATTSGALLSASPIQPIPFDLAGAFFSGLSNSTTVRLTGRWLIERVPTYQEPDLVVMARPSPPLDPVALSIYSKVMRQMPSGVPLSENADGGWFEGIINTVKKWAPSVASAVSSIPVIGAPLSLAVRGAGMVASGISSGMSTSSASTRAPRPGNSARNDSSVPVYQRRSAAPQRAISAKSQQDDKNKKKKKPVRSFAVMRRRGRGA